jgi:heptosyltransferase-2
MTKIAVIQTAFPGDLILATPVFEALKAHYPDCRISAVIRPESSCLLRNNPYIDNILIYDKYGADKGLAGMWKMSGRLKGHDKAIIVQRHFRSALIAFLAGIPDRVGFDISSARLLYTSRIRYNYDKHEVERCLDLVGAGDSDFRPHIYIDSESSQQMDNLLQQNGINSNFAAVAPGSVWPTKRYVHYSRLIDLVYETLGLRSVLLGGPDDKGLAQSIAGSTAHRPVDLCGQTDLIQSAAIIAKAKILFCNDSAPMHIAAAVGTPVVAVFGPTVPSFGFAPYSENSIVVDIGKLECRPCSIHGSKKCPRGHFKCMRELPADRIIERGRLLLTGVTGERLD